MQDRDLIRHISRSPSQKAGYKQLVRELGMGGGRERRLLLEQLARLTLRGELVKVDREHWAIQARAVSRENLIAGRLDLHRDGYGFVRPNARQAAEEDIFIPPGEMNGAMQGDQVLVELAPPRRGNDGRDGSSARRMGRIARVLERKNATIVGVFHYARSQNHPGHIVVPFDERMTQPVLIPLDAELPDAATAIATAHRVLGEEAQAASHYDDLEGLVVDVEIESWPTPTRSAIGRVIEVLGHQDDFGVDVEMMIRKHQLPRVFPENVLTEARSLAHVDQEEVARRRDFRGLPIVTIDGETAKDFDDAVLVRELPGGGYELQVHIADVAEYVREGSDLDLEARLRGTSVYFPDRAIPMLPQELSTDICSLRPGEDRLVLSCLMQLNEQAEILHYEIVEGVIRSAARMTYSEVAAILEDDAVTRARYPELVPEFERMRELAQLLHRRRQMRGSIDFDLPEPILEFDEFGKMRGVTRAVRNWAHRLIEEFMLAANESVATWLEDLGVPGIYRIHEKPSPKRVVDFEEAAASFGYSLGIGALPVKRVVTKGDRREAKRGNARAGGRGGREARAHEIPEDIAVTPKMYQKLTARIEGKPEERILSYLMLRSLKQARYSEINEGHFALASPTYTHFTSPIRRYPDLNVHRICKALLRAGVVGEGVVPAGRHGSPWGHVNEGTARVQRTAAQAVFPGEPPIPEAELAQIATETSQTERRAAEAERELVEWKKVRFMQDRVGEEFDAMVLNPTKHGLFVELEGLFVEGLVPIDSLRSDRFSYRENTREIAGDSSGRVFRAGDAVRVVLERVLVQERRLQFALVDEESVYATKRSGRGQKTAKSNKKKAQIDAARSTPNKKGFKFAKFMKKKRR